jgi:hypothetical protein
MENLNLLSFDLVDLSELTTMGLASEKHDGCGKKNGNCDAGCGCGGSNGSCGASAPEAL